MFLKICGVALVVIACIFYWRLLPRNGKVHRLVENSDVGSMITITIMTMFAFGMAMFFGGSNG